MPTYTVHISDYKWDIFKKKFKDYCKKAKKLGFTEPDYIIVKDYPKDATLVYPLTTTVRFREVLITYDMPIINGWEVIGNRERIDGSIFTNTVTGDNVSSYHKSENIGCDHCGTNRYRNKSIMLKNKVGTIIEVGSTCVVDFFGHKVSKLDWFISEKFLDEEWGIIGGGAVFQRFNLVAVLTISSSYIRSYGYHKAADLGYSTKDRVWDCHLPSEQRCIHYKEPDITEADEELANSVLAYWKSLNPNEHFANSYVTNLIKIAEKEDFAVNLLGYAVSMVSSYQKVMEKIEEERMAKRGKPSEYQGELKERLTGLKLKCVFKKAWNNDWGGTTQLMKFRDCEGNIFITFYQGSLGTPEKDETLILDGTVVKHDEFNGIRQTTVNRIRIMMGETV